MEFNQPISGRSMMTAIMLNMAIKARLLADFLAYPGELMVMLPLFGLRGG
jgi:hypothetical protein